MEELTFLTGFCFLLGVLFEIPKLRLLSASMTLCLKILSSITHYVRISIPEYIPGRVTRNPTYSAVESYLAASSPPTTANQIDNGQFHDKFRGEEFEWSCKKHTPPEPRCYQIAFDCHSSNLVFNDYLPHILEEATRRCKLYTNNPIKNHYDSPWNYIDFRHSATFDTLAMDTTMKQEILVDLDTFPRGKGPHSSLEKASKRSYLLYGPPTTCKSPIIAAMANHMSYDVYVIDVTIVKTISDLKNLLIQTTNRSIIVFEDIDCSLDLAAKKTKDEEDEKIQMTVYGLLKIINGMWFACKEDQLIVFTTDHIEKSDMRLLAGQINKLIDISHCSSDRALTPVRKE